MSSFGGPIRRLSAALGGSVGRLESVVLEKVCACARNGASLSLSGLCVNSLSKILS